MKPIMIADMPIAVSGTDLIRKYETGANMVPARQNPRPIIRYELFKISSLNGVPPYMI